MNEKANLEPTVPALLDAAKETFHERREQHGRADVTFGAVMAALFPNGVTLMDENDQRAFQMLGHVVGKLTRFVNSGMKHKDSIHDTITYAALLESMVDSHNIKIGD